jgi:hypothetical protein
MNDNTTKHHHNLEDIKERIINKKLNKIDNEHNKASS